VSFANASAAARSKSPWSLPSPPATSAATALPRTAASRGARPILVAYTKPAENASPQPVVSTTSIASAGTLLRPFIADDQRSVGAARDRQQPDARIKESTAPVGKVCGPGEAEDLVLVGQQVVRVGHRGRDEVERPHATGRDQVDGRGDIHRAASLVA